MKYTISKAVTALLYDCIRDAGWNIQDMPPAYLDFPSDERFGDFSSTIALQISKTLRISPRQVASTLLELFQKKLTNHSLASVIQDIKIEGAGFLNFYVRKSFFQEELQTLLTQKQDFFKIDAGKGKKVMLEFVSANPTGPLSVAHARQAVVGDCLANIFSFLGYSAHKEYYLNDEGNQINILGASVRARYQELKGEKVDFAQNYYQGDYIYDIARVIEKEGKEPADWGEFAGEYILQIIRTELNDFGVLFDCWYSQKQLRLSGKIDAGLDQLRKLGFVYDQDGAVWLKSTAFGDDKDRVVIKSDGSYTYLAPDIAYHQEKFLRGFELLINFWGPDHHGYISRLKASIQAFGHPASALDVVIVQLASIFRDGKPVEMSTRKGQYITLREVLDEVGVDASRFFFVMRRTSSHLDFDLEVAKKQTSENPVYYVQYAHARICSILRSSQLDFTDANYALLIEPEEMRLIKKMIQLTSVLEGCVSTRDPYMLTVYLQELSECFHKFYDRHRVLGTDEQLSKARLALIQGVQLTIETSLKILGISCPDKM